MATRLEIVRGVREMQRKLNKHRELLQRLFAHPDFKPAEHLEDLQAIAAASRQIEERVRHLNAELYSRRLPVLEGGLGLAK